MIVNARIDLATIAPTPSATRPWLRPLAIDWIAPAPGENAIAIDAPRKPSHKCQSLEMVCTTAGSTSNGHRIVHFTLYSLLTGAWLCISFTRPALPKSISDIADSPTPDTSSTRPRPYLSWVTRSPGSSTSSGRLPAADRVGAGRGVPNLPAPLTGADSDGGGSTRRQSMSSCGISFRKRDSGFSIG